MLPGVGWSGVYFIVTVTTVTVINKNVGVGFISFFVLEAIVIRFYTILQHVFSNKCWK